MKNINSVIQGKIIEIICLLFIIIGSFPLWEKLDRSEYFTTAAFYNNAKYSYLEVFDKQELNSPIKNADALKLLPKTKIDVINDTKTKEDYTLILKVSKSSTLDYHCLNLAIENNVKPLEKYYLHEDNDHIYFALASGSILGEKKNYNLVMWMDETTGNEMQGKTFSYAYELQDGIKI